MNVDFIFINQLLSCSNYVKLLQFPLTSILTQKSNVDSSSVLKKKKINNFSNALEIVKHIEFILVL